MTCTDAVACCCAGEGTHGPALCGWEMPHETVRMGAQKPEFCIQKPLAMVSARQMSISCNVRLWAGIVGRGGTRRAGRDFRQDSRKRFSPCAPCSLGDALSVALEASTIPDVPMRVLHISSTTEADVFTQRGAGDVLTVVADAPAEAGADANPLGNVAEPRTWVGSVESLPSYMGPFSVAVIDEDCLAEQDEMRSVLLKCSLMMRPAGHALVYSSSGKRVSVELVEGMVRDLCFDVVSALEGGEVLLQVPANFALASSIRMEGEVVEGYGRGSRNLGVPTANLRPADVAAQVDGLPLGVYFGFARLAGQDVTRKMVMNIGKRPTFVEDNGPEESIEVHVMDFDGADFYGARLEVLVCGFLRPEMKFDGLDALLNRIHTDIGVARSQLDCDRFVQAKEAWHAS